MALNFDSARLHNPYLRPEHEEWRTQLRKFLDAEVSPYLDQWEEAGKLPPVEDLVTVGNLTSRTNWSHEIEQLIHEIEAQVWIAVLIFLCRDRPVLSRHSQFSLGFIFWLWIECRG